MKTILFTDPRIIEVCPNANLEKFGDEHGLILIVHRRQGTCFNVQFENSEIKKGGLLIGEYGRGITMSDAMDN